MYKRIDNLTTVTLRVAAETLEELYAEIGKALFSVLLKNPESVQPVREETVTLALGVNDLDDLLYNWVSELLTFFEMSRLVFCEFKVNIDYSENREILFTAVIAGEQFDLKRHQPDLFINAISYQGLQIVKAPRGYTASFTLER